LDEAEQEFKRALDKDPSNVQAYIGLGTVHTAKKDYEQALVELQKAIESDPNAVGAYNQIAKVYLIRGQLDLAIQTCEKGTAIAPESAPAYRILGDTYLQRFNIYRQRQAASEAEEALKKAEEAFKKVLQINPNNAETHISLADLYVLMGKTDEAEQQYQKLTTIDPKNKVAYLKLAQLYIGQSQPDKAEALYRSMQEIDPKDVASRLALGRLYTVQKKYPAAIAEYESALEFAPYTPQIQMNLMVLHNQENQFAQAIERGTQLERRLPTNMPDDPKQAQVLRSLREVLSLNQGRAYLGQKDYISAIKYLQQLVDFNPKSAVTHYRLGLAYTGVKNYRQAVTEYKRALELDTALIIAQLRLANAYIALKTPLKTISECQKILDPSNPNRALISQTDKAEAHHLSGIAHLALGNNKKALSQLQLASELNPDSAKIYATMGNFYSQQNQFLEAKRYHQMAIERKEDTASAHQGLAYVYTQLGETDKAIAEYNRTIELSPDSPSAHNNLAWYYATQEINLDTALEMANKALTMTPQSAIFRDTLGVLYYKKKMYPQAIIELRTASLGAKDNPQIYYHLGMAYLADGKPDIARQNLLASLDINPNFPKATEAKKLLEQITDQIGGENE